MSTPFQFAIDTLRGDADSILRTIQIFRSNAENPAHGGDFAKRAAEKRVPDLESQRAELLAAARELRMAEQRLAGHSQSALREPEMQPERGQLE